MRFGVAVACSLRIITCQGFYGDDTPGIGHSRFLHGARAVVEDISQKSPIVRYKFYLDDENDDANLIGIIPERRRNPVRITRESIIKLGQLVAGTYVSADRIRFIRVEERQQPLS